MQLLYFVLYLIALEYEVLRLRAILIGLSPINSVVSTEKIHIFERDNQLACASSYGPLNKWLRWINSAGKKSSLEACRIIFSVDWREESACC